MAMSFEILSYVKGKEFKPSCKTAVISITDPGEGGKHPKYDLSRNIVSVLRLKFLDYDPTSKEDLNFKGSFQYQHAANILNFVKLWNDEVSLITCQCMAGRSRSAAVAAALSVIFNGSRSDNWIFENYTPNRYVYRTILDVSCGQITS